MRRVIAAVSQPKIRGADGGGMLMEGVSSAGIFMRAFAESLV